MILWDGACMVHELFSVGDLLTLKRRLPHAVTLAHPECPANIREHSDYVGGTQGMIKFVANLSEPQDILVATEANMMWQLQHKFPRHRYHGVPGITCACNKCPHMARNTLAKLRDCLASGSPEIPWQESFGQARKVLERSLLE
jgi:quinolinate synthase